MRAFRYVLYIVFFFSGLRSITHSCTKYIASRRFALSNTFHHFNRQLSSLTVSPPSTRRSIHYAFSSKLYLGQYFVFSFVFRLSSIYKSRRNYSVRRKHNHCGSSRNQYGRKCYSKFDIFVPSCSHTSCTRGSNNNKNISLFLYRHSKSNIQ